MSELYKNKYRIASARAAWWDYTNAGAYFITICTKNRLHYFGKIQEEKMQLSHCGVIADILWHEISHRYENVELGAFVVMPNHIHGILFLNENDDGNNNDNENLAPVQKRFRNPGKNSISSIIGGYKAAVSKHAKRLHIDFSWQSRFHDHIIQDQGSLKRIENYIAQNPARWPKDCFYNS